MDYLYIITIGLLIFFSFSLLTKGKKPLSEIIISVWIVLLIITEVSFLLYVKSLSGRFSIFTALICDTQLAHGVLLYFYIKAFTNPVFRLETKHLWHALPILMVLVFKLSMNFVFGTMECYTGGVCVDETDNIFIILVYIYKYSVLIAYLFFAYKLVKSYGENAKTPREQMRYGWLKQIIQGVVFLITGNLLLLFGSLFFTNIFLGQVILSNTLATFFILIFLYIGNSYTYIFVSPSKKRFINLSESFNPDNCKKDEHQKNWEEAYDKIEAYMKSEEPYTEAQLTVNDFSLKLNIPVQLISLAINNMTGHNFNDYINGYRVNKLKLLLDDSSNHKYKIMSLANDCGFNSKSSLIRVFKKHTELTPSQYLGQVINKG